MKTKPKNTEESAECRRVSLDPPEHSQPATVGLAAMDHCQAFDQPVEWDEPSTAELESLAGDVLKQSKNFTEENLLHYATRRLPTMSEGAARCLVIGAVTGARLASNYSHFWRDNIRSQQTRARQGAAAAAGELARWAMGFHADLVMSPGQEDHMAQSGQQPFRLDESEEGEFGSKLESFPVSFARAAQQLVEDSCYDPPRSPHYSPLCIDKQPSDAVKYSPTPIHVLQGAAKLRDACTKKKEKTRSPSPRDVEPDSGTDAEEFNKSAVIPLSGVGPVVNMPMLVQAARQPESVTGRELVIDVHAPSDPDIVSPSRERSTGDRARPSQSSQRGGHAVEQRDKHEDRHQDKTQGDENRRSRDRRRDGRRGDDGPRLHFTQPHIRYSRGTRGRPYHYRRW